MATFKADLTRKDIAKVSGNIKKNFYDKKIIAFALAQSMAVKMLNEFRERQSNNEFWTNRTQQAFQRVFTGAEKSDSEIYFFIAHGVEYGSYLEFANDRQNEALRPLSLKYGEMYFKALAEIY